MMAGQGRALFVENGCTEKEDLDLTASAGPPVDILADKNSQLLRGREGERQREKNQEFFV